MQQALTQARRALDSGEVPVGAVVVAPDNRTIIGRGHNRTRADHDPTAHAEIIALRAAAAKLGTPRLVDCRLYVTLEPCPMCAGALIHARIARLIFGAYDLKYGAIDHGIRLFDRPDINHRPETIGGVAESRCGRLLAEFFSTRRQGISI